MFMVLVDVETVPACLTGWLGESGYIERSLVYLRDLDPVRAHYADMLRVREHVTLHRYNERISAFLASHDDPPLPDPPSRNRGGAVASPSCRAQTLPATGPRPERPLARGGSARRANVQPDGCR